MKRLERCSYSVSDDDDLSAVKHRRYERIVIGSEELCCRHQTSESLPQ